MGGRSAKTPFSSVLVANRGEIALRIMRTARSMGLRTIAVFTDADSDAEYVAFADASVRIGDGPPASSYLAVDRILDAARQTGAAAIHPGYGFLSENADFARAVTDAGLIFVGPPPDAIAAMGNKAEAKRRMIAAGVSCVPGYQGRGQSDKALRDAANKIGYPVMVKAASGGGGRGMRLVSRAGALKSNLADARAEASSAFGSDELILERAFLGPRHVEIQVISDKYGHTIHLGERDCSLQRRHQKVVEEAPSPAVSSRLRARMGRAAVAAANQALPDDRPRYLMGLGRPIDLLDGVAAGVDLFDCVVPTRNGRHGLLFTSEGTVSLRNAGHAWDQDPVDRDCPCPGCRQHSRGYLRHLIKTGESLGRRLSALHNLTYYLRLLTRAREAIENGGFAALHAEIEAIADVRL